VSQAPVILATQEAEIRRSEVQGQPGQIVLKTLSWKNPSLKRAGGVAQGVGLEFKPQYWRGKKKKDNYEWEVEKIQKDLYKYNFDNVVSKLESQ
jgi:hypothetical protein